MAHHFIIFDYNVIINNGEMYIYYGNYFKYALLISIYNTETHAFFNQFNNCP